MMPRTAARSHPGPEQLRVRNVYFQAYHRALRLINTHGLDHPFGQLWADACEAYEARYTQLEQRLDRGRTRQVA